MVSYIVYCTESRPSISMQDIVVWSFGQSANCNHGSHCRDPGFHKTPTRLECKVMCADCGVDNNYRYCTPNNATSRAF